jgi:hypothetical protein
LNEATEKLDVKTRILNHLPLLMATLLGMVVLVMIPMIRNVVMRKNDDAEYTRIKESPIALNEGIRLAASERTWEAAWKTLHRALNTALTPRARLAAMLAIGEHLVTRAQRNPAEYALPARQYLRTVFLQEARPDRQLRARLGLLAVARLQADLTEIRQACADLHQTPVPEEEKSAVLLAQFDAMLPMGQWSDIHPLLQELMPYCDEPRLGTDIQLRWVAAHEQVLKNNDFFAGWLKKQRATGATGSSEELRQTLVEKLLACLDAIAKSADPGSDEARFRAFRLTFREGLFSDASRRLNDLHMNNLGPFQREALLLSVEIARHESRLTIFHDRVQQYINTYDIDADIEPAFFESLDLLMSGGKGTQGLAILQQKLEQNVQPGLRARLLRYTGNLARKLQNDTVADRCFAAILNLPEALDCHPMALLARGAIAADEGDMATACQWLIRYLNRFPGEREWDETALDLFTQLGNAPEKAGSDLIVAALLLSQRKPYDPHTLNVLLLAAQRLEALGLTSMAHDYYNRISLLPPPRLAKPPQENQNGTTVAPAITMANIRCLLDMDRKAEADRLLRVLCNNPVSSTARSEAALLWATLALERGQKQEGERRLGLIDPKLCDSNVVWQAKVHRMILQIGATTNAPGLVTDLMAAIHEPAAATHPELVRQAFQTCFATLAARNDNAGLRTVLAAANAANPAATQEEYRLQIAKLFLARKDYTAAAEWLQNAPQGLSNAVAVIEKNNQLVRKFR